jgi:hypothetical protein
MEPMTMAGALIGANLNEFLPDLVIVVLLLLLLSLTAYQTLTKACSLYRKESIQREKEEMASEQEELIASTKSEYGTVASDTESLKADKLEVTREESTVEPEVKHQAWVDALKLTGLFVVVTLLNFLDGGPNSGTGPFPQCGEACFWTSQAGILFVIVLFSLWVRTGLLQRIKSGGPVTSDIHWDSENTITYPFMAVVAGLVAGMFGIGTSPCLMAFAPTGTPFSNTHIS